MTIMRAYIIILILVTIGLILGSPVHAAEEYWFYRDYQFADEWNTQDTILEVIHTGLWLIDWHQTREIAKYPERWHEHNPILGHHPTMR